MTRRLPLFLACLVLCGFGTCRQYLEANQAAKARAAEMKGECAVLKSRVITFEEEKAFGGAVGVRWVSEGGGLTTHADRQALERQLNKIGRNLAAQSSRPRLPWVFGVLQSEGVNAVSGPGGYVFVSEGLLARLDDEAQLAGVLAHEIAHITRKHALNEYQAFLVRECEEAAETEGLSAKTAFAGEVAVHAGRAVQDKAGDVVGGLFGSGGQWSQVLAQVARSKVKSFNIDEASEDIVRVLVSGFVDKLADKGFQEADEFAADLDAVELMAAAGYEPDAYVTFLGKLPSKGLSTPHPGKTERQEKLRGHLQDLRARAETSNFLSPGVLSSTRVVPLRDELLTRRAGVASP